MNYKVLLLFLLNICFVIACREAIGGGCIDDDCGLFKSCLPASSGGCLCKSSFRNIETFITFVISIFFINFYREFRNLKNKLENNLIDKNIKK